MVDIRGWRGEADLRRLYLAYYRRRPPLGIPRDIRRREFAFQLFGRGPYVRHLSFGGEEELRGFLEEKGPRHAYYSTAIYELPEAGSMEEKGWLGSELLVDIDADNLDDCPISRSARGVSVPEDECLVKCFDAALRARRMIERDLGWSSRIYFTGNRGFHVLAWGEEVMGLGREERRQIAWYLAGESLSLQLLFPVRGHRGAVAASPRPGDPGWRGLIAGYLGTGGEPVPSVLGDGWLDRVREAVEALRVPLDPQVTQDVSRLARIEGSLNGKSSLLVTEAQEGFRPGPGLSPFRGWMEARALDDLEEARVLGKTLSLRRGEHVSLEAWIGVYLATRGLVEPLRGEVVV